MPHETKRTLFLAVPGTQETRELALDAVRSAVERGEITLDNWAWSAERKEWVPLSQLPEFAPPVAPAAPPIPAVRVEAKIPVVAKVAAGGAPTAVKVAPVAVDPVNLGPTISTPSVMAVGTKLAGTVYSKPIREHHEFPIFKILFVVLGLIIAALVGVNYGLVDKPFRDKMDQTPFKGIQAHAHLGAFIQPSVLLIHIVPSPQITSDNFADFLAALTKAAPRGAVSGQFNTVGLTSSWFGQYAITAENWDGFASMGGFTPNDKKEYILSHLERINGDPLVIQLKNETPEQIKARTDKVWNDLILHFQTGA